MATRGSLAQDGLEVPGREGEAARRSVGDDLGDPRLPVEHGQLPEEVARARGRRSVSPSRTTRTAPRR